MWRLLWLIAVGALLTADQQGCADEQPVALHLLDTIGGWHKHAVLYLAFSPDGQAITSAESNTVRQWNLATGKRISALHKSRLMNALALSADGRLVASKLMKGYELIEIATGKAIASFETNNNSITKITISPDGKTVASASVGPTIGGMAVFSPTKDSIIEVWDVSSGKLRTTLREQLQVVRALSFSSDGKILASGGDDKIVHLWNVATSQEIARLNGHNAQVISVSFSPDASSVASSSVDRTVKIWDVVTGRNTRTLTHTQSVDCLAYSRDGNILATGSSLPHVKLWDVRSGKNVANLVGHTSSISAVAFSPDGQTILSASSDKSVRTWSLSTRKQIAAYPKEYTGELTSVAYSPDGKLLASASDDKRVVLWDTKDWKCAVVLSGHAGAVCDVAFSPDGNSLVSVSGNSAESSTNEIKIWDVANHKNIATHRQRDGTFRRVALSPDGKHLAVVCMRMSPSPGRFVSGIVLWDLDRRDKIQTLECNLNDNGPLLFSRDGKTLAAGTNNGEIKLWDLASGENRLIKAHSQSVDGIAISPDGMSLASCGDEGNTKVWDMSTGKQLSTLEGISAVRSIAYCPNGENLVSVVSGLFSTIQVWDIANQKVIAKMIPFSNNITYIPLAVSPDGRILVSGNFDDNSIKVWRLAPH